MLVLSRIAGQAIVIEGGRIKVEIVEVNRHNVRLGIHAPDDVVIDREEVHARRAGGCRESPAEVQP